MKGISTEFLITIGMILVGFIFFLVTRGLISREAEVVYRMSVKETVEYIAELIEKVRVEPDLTIVCSNIPRSEIEVKDGTLIVTRGGVTSVANIPFGVSDMKVVTSKICVLKKETEMVLVTERLCIDDEICEVWECLLACKDCVGPDPICVGDGECTLAIRENCNNSIDCLCDGKVCCPPSPDANEIGCSNISNLTEGEECWCSNQCRLGLNCNAVAFGFTEYDRGCCPDKRGWNGTECIIVCDYDGVCEPEECKVDCADCYGPANICIGDGYCNLYIDESCLNSPTDCPCNGKLCCPSDPISDKHGCSDRSGLGKGEECFCSNQCESGLSCNPTTKDFYEYDKACCPPGMGWNGIDCITIDVFDVFIVPVAVGDSASYNSVANGFINHFMETSPFRECSDKWDRVKFWVVQPDDCPSAAGTSSCHHCSSCISIGRSCARTMESKFGVAYDKFVVLTHSGGWYGGCACGIPCDGSSSSILSCSDRVCVPTHEIGHNLGLGHVDCGVACHACIYGNPNCPDCGLPDRAEFIMDYCVPMKKFGPAGYNFLKTGYIGTPPYSAGLARWLRGC